MERSTKQFTQRIRQARPRVHTSDAFVDTLRVQLQRRAVVLSTQQADAVPSQRWLERWSSRPIIMGAAMGMVVLAVVIIVPHWSGVGVGVNGFIQKGPFISGSTITIQELDDQLQPSGKSYQITTASDFGDYRLDQSVRSDYIEVIAEGFYFDEVRGELSSAPLTLRAIADVSDGSGVNVNILTTLTGPRIRQIMQDDGREFMEAKRIAEQEVLAVFQITEPSINDFEAMNMSEAGLNNGILLAVSVMLQGHQSVAELSELLSKLSLAIETDGTLNERETLLETVKTNTSQLNTSAIHDNLEQRFQEVGASGTVPDFAQWLEPFAATADPFGYRITLLDNIFDVNRQAGANIEVTIYGNDFIEGRETVALKNTVDATSVDYIDEQTLIATFPIERLSAGSYTVVVKNNDTGRTGVTDGLPLEDVSTTVSEQRLVLRGLAPTIRSVTASIPYLSGGTVNITGQHYGFGSFVWINDWQVPNDAIRIVNDQLIQVDLSPALIVNNDQLPRNTALTITVQTPDFQTAQHVGFMIQ